MFLFLITLMITLNFSYVCAMDDVGITKRNFGHNGDGQAIIIAIAGDEKSAQKIKISKRSYQWLKELWDEIGKNHDSCYDSCKICCKCSGVICISLTCWAGLLILINYLRIGYPW